LEHNSFSFVEFYSRRIRRIFPALLLVLTASFAFGWFGLLADEYKQLGKHIAGGSGFVSNFVLWNESGYFDNSAATKPLLHLWSLGIEEQFYIIWPLLLVFVWKRKWSFVAITAIVAVISFALNICTINKYPTAAYYLPAPRFWELMIGGLLAYIGLHKPHLNEKHKNTQSILGFILIILGLVLINKERAFPGWWALLPALGTFLLISAGPKTWLNRHVLSSKLLVWIGLISYPLYLWHWPLLSFAHILESETPTLNIRIVAVTISILLAWLTYILIEKPIRFGGHGKEKAITLLALMVVVGFVGYIDYKGDGLKFRDAEKVTRINSFGYPYKQSCEALTGDRGDDWCNSGTSNNGNPKIVLIGDSYSNSYSTMFNAYAKNNANVPIFIQFARGECPSLNDYGPEYCKEITAKIFDYIKSHSEVEKVVLASEWPAYFHDRTWADHHENTETFKAAFEKTIRDYQSIGKQLIILLAPPFGSNPRSCIVRQVRLTDKNICNLTKDEALANDENYRDYLLPKLRAGNISYFDPFIYFCDNEHCKITDGKKIFFTDLTHLSTFGGEFLANKGKDKLDELFLK
jgi:peptidoglycan/LPS O-acetylase OafA/YrhL